MKKQFFWLACFALIAIVFASTAFITINKFDTKAADSIVAETLTGGYQIGDVATDFSLKNVDETLVSMADYPDAKGYIVIFSCNSCPYVVLN